MILQNPVLLRDALQNMAPDSGAPVQYVTGLIVGVVATLMAMGMTWQQAIVKIADECPWNARRECVPPTWQFEFNARMEETMYSRRHWSDITR